MLSTLRKHKDSDLIPVDEGKGEISELMLEYSSLINQNWSYMDGRESSKARVTGLKGNVWYEYEARLSNNQKISALLWNYEVNPYLSTALEEVVRCGVRAECANAGLIMRLALTVLAVGDSKLLSLLKGFETPGAGKYDVISSLSWSCFTRTNNDDLNECYAYPFVNISEYSKYKSGVFHNINIVKLYEGKYIGFDPGFLSSPRSKEELVKYLFEQFTNDKDLKHGMKKEHAEFCKDLTPARFQCMRASYQEQVGYYIFDQKKVENLLCK